MYGLQELAACVCKQCVTGEVIVATVLALREDQGMHPRLVSWLHRRHLEAKPETQYQVS